MSATDRPADTEKATRSPVSSPPIADARQPHSGQSDIFFAAVKTTRMPMIVTDPRQPDNPIVFCNEAFSFMTGYSEEEILGTNCRFLQGPETDRDVVAQIRAAIERRDEIAVELLNYRKNGSTFWNALFISPVYDDAGELVYFFSSQLDISRRRDAEDALHEAQKMEACVSSIHRRSCAGAFCAAMMMSASARGSSFFRCRPRQNRSASMA